MSVIVTGDDSVLAVTLKKSNVVFLINPAATVKAAVVSVDKSIQLIPAVTCSNVATGADWANSLVVVEFASAETGAITDAMLGEAILEIQVDDGGKLTWFVLISIEKGTIA